MNKILKNILVEKEKEVSLLRLYSNILDTENRVLTGAFSSTKIKLFRTTLLSHQKSVIAEVKRRSPSKPHIAEIPDPSSLASRYVEGGAAAISILTDNKFFGGSLDDLRSLKHSPIIKDTPILRKDFIIDPLQIIESYEAGADCILLIVAALGRDKTGTLLNFAWSMGLDAIVEVHTYQELDIALDAGADIIGINNRNLETFKIDTGISVRMVSNIPKGIIKISESGITSIDAARTLFGCGFDAVLIGEMLASSSYPEKIIKEIIS
ncbi:MAG: hypothetical protein A2X47_07225 [Lentisphaerae bacterium GWF2_38_69]|nr:MAG: hypothetical protein A2X47_07225 [Lentisphaerae bacterium GWF2_38_69]